MITPISHFHLKYESFHTGFSKLLISFRNAYFDWQILVAPTKFEVGGRGGAKKQKTKKNKTKNSYFHAIVFLRVLEFCRLQYFCDS